MSEDKNIKNKVKHENDEIESVSFFLESYNQFKKMNSNQQVSSSELQKEFSEVWNTYQTNKANQKLTFDINRFIQDTYLNTYNRVSSKKYKKSDIERFLDNPQNYQEALREVSKWMYNTSQEYKNLNKYFSKMLTFDYILRPNSVNPKIYKHKKFMSSFYDNLQFLEDYNLKYKLGLVTEVLIKEDFWFGYEKTDGVNYVWQRLPSNYCRILGFDAYETYVFEFDFSYFSNTNIKVENYGDEFKEKFQLYKSNQVNRWQKLDPNKAICFKYDESVLYGLPMFSGMFDSLFRLEDIKDVQNTNDKLNNYKLLSQQIPMDTKDNKKNGFLIDEIFAAKFHNNVKSNVPEGIGVVTTPMKIEGIVLKNSGTVEEDLVAKETRNLFTTSGTSQLVFNSDKSGALGLERSIQKDETFMFSLLKQYMTWLKKRMKLFNNGSSSARELQWKVDLPFITHYNKDDMFEKLLKAAQFGYEKEIVAASLGTSQANLLNAFEMENNQLMIVDKMVPLKSSHVGNNEDEGGRPKSKVKNLSENGLITRDTNANNNRV